MNEYIKIPGGWRYGNDFLGFRGIGKSRKEALETFNRWLNTAIRTENDWMSWRLHYSKKQTSIIMRDYNCNHTQALKILHERGKR